MERIIKVMLLAPLSLALGCFPESKNNLPDKYLHEDDRIPGVFTQGKATEAKNCERIEKVEGKKGQYVLIPSAILEAQLPIRLFKIGDSTLGSILLNPEEPVFLFFRLYASENQLRFHFLDKEWLFSNQSAIPGTTQFTEKKTVLKATPEELYHFFQKHGKSEGIFDNKNIYILNRVKK